MLGRLVGQLARAGARVQVRATAPPADLSAAVPAGTPVTSLVTAVPDERVVLVDADVVASFGAVETLVRDVRLRTGTAPGAVLLVGADTAMSGHVDAAAATDALATAGRPPPPLPLDGFAWSTVRHPSAVPEALAAADGVDDDAVRLRRAVKSSDGLFTTYAISTWSRYVARWCARRGFTPNQVTSASMAVGAAAAACYALGERPWLVAGGVLLLVSFALDCVDGQLARYTLQFSPLGAWLDATFDRVKEYLAYAGMAVGAHRLGAPDVWPLATAAMLLQTLRHQVDLSFALARDADPAAADRGTRVAAMSARTSQARLLYWAKRVVVLPVGERFALLALATVLGGVRVAFVALLVWGGVAAAYTLSGRVLRSVAA